MTIKRSEGCNFSDARLVAKYGTWFSVQVAFYDFLFTSSMKLCVTHCREEMLADFRDGADPYERAKKAVEKKYPTMDKAWEAFISKETP